MVGTTKHIGSVLARCDDEFVEAWQIGRVIDAALLDAAKVRIAERGGTPNCTFVEADAYDVAKVAPQPVDHVFLPNAFHGVPDKPRLARGVYDVLKPGGLFAIVSWYARPREETTVLGSREDQRRNCG